MSRSLVCLLGFALIFTACKKSPPANVAATVNGSVISHEQVDRIYRSQYDPAQRGGSDDMVTIQRLEIARGLIEREILLQRAERLGLLATDAEVDARFNEFRAPYTEDELQRKLAERKMTVNDIKTEIRNELSVQKLVNKEITSKISITDREITDFYNANKASFNRPEPTLHLGQILVTAAPDPNVRNLKNDKAQNDEQARKKVQLIEQRIRNGEDFGMLAENYSEDPQSAPNSGDLGFLPMSAFEQSSPEIKKLLSALQPGQVSPIIPGQGSYRIIKLLSREPAGQRDLNDPRVQQEIRQTLLGSKEQLMRNAYYEVARTEAKVVNFLAQRVLGDKK
ncbi:MAG TPA: peptidylprolyl isomerase [Bryobacteraceae bacterium]|nr:peptidylprolyl isomerase [Bryobacteraceae bacterium]